MNDSESPQSRYIGRKIALESVEAIETVAAATIANVNLEHSQPVYNSHDAVDENLQAADKPNFILSSRKGVEDSFNEYGVNIGIKNDIKGKWSMEQTPTKKAERTIESSPRKKKQRLSPGDRAKIQNTPGDDEFVSMKTLKEHNSEVDAVELQVKRNNLVDLFLRGTKVDAYLAEHVYGNNFEEKLNTSIENGSILDDTIMHQVRLLQTQALQDGQEKKMGPWETYVSLLKGYTSIEVLLLPRAFARGGWFFAAFCLAFSACMNAISATRLVQAAKKLNARSYSQIAARAFGPCGKIVLDIMIVLTQFSFAVSLITFITSAWKSFLKEVCGFDLTLWTVAGILMVILLPVVFVRELKKFAVTFLIGNICTLAAAVIVSSVMVERLAENDGEPGPDRTWMNFSEFWGMVGFSCYAYEGIGVVMPMYQACECKDKFDKIILAVLLTISTFYITFSQLVYYVMGNSVTHDFITEELDQKSTPVIVLQIVFSLSLCCSYAIMIYPANNIIEDNLLKPIQKCFSPQADGKFVSNFMWYLTSLSRLFIFFCATFVAVELSSILERFLSLLGALLCAPLAIAMPALIHLKVQAETTREKLVDIFLIALAVFVLVVCTANVLLS